MEEPPLSENPDDVAELLALVDELYTPHASIRRRRIAHHRPRRLAATAERKQLRDQADRLERTLDLMRRRRRDPGQWEHVAHRQRRQRDAAIRVNALLRHTMRRVAAVAFRKLRSLARPPHGGVQMTMQTLGTVQAPPALIQRLDLACASLASRETRVVGHNTRHHEVVWREGQPALRFNVRSTAQYPFRLSSVADEVWRLMIQAQPLVPTLSQDEINCADSTFQIHKPFGYISVHGPSATRRVYTQDGGVLVVSVSIQTGAGEDDETDNLMAGLVMHETMWVRVVRADMSNPRSPVFVEIVTESDVFPTASQASGVFTEDSTEHRDSERLHKIRDFIHSYAVEDHGGGQQRLENRLMDASLARGRGQSQLE